MNIPQWPVHDETDARAVLAALDSGHWGRHDGQYADRFEQAFADYLGAGHAVAVCNGTIALRLALLAAGIAAGDEVIVPPYTFIATASAVVECNAVPVFADIEAHSHCLDPAAVAAAITPRTRAIVVVHLAGRAADMTALRALADTHGLMLIEDACHAHGADLDGRKLGTLGDLGCFSFQSSKNLTCGEGGAVVTDNAGLAARVRSLHDCGRRAGGKWYEHVTLGGNYRLGELQAALLCSQLARLDAQTATRDANGRRLDALLAEIPGLTPVPPAPGQGRHSRHLYVWRFDAATVGKPREAFLAAVQARGVPAVPGYLIPLYRQEVFVHQRFGPYQRPAIDYAAVDCPVTERVCSSEGCWLSQVVLLGSAADMETIAAAMREACS